MFIVSLNYTSTIEEIDMHITEHLMHLDKQYSLGNFIASGRKEPRTGGFILATVESKVELESILSNYPFYREKLAEFVVTEFIPTKTSPELSFLLDA
ncbi:YciI family protein [Colwellia psychrerythraea]|uniref:YCII-related protein n=1 Tax=Colwellia psychrerythraea TaxID=28229 RepID=A0A099KY54_COLPS|nr:YciI family protein [Colwellia psychrerythraea]KGJ95100.1 YCII-related protein [Colwellia psychrerythraea]